MLAVWKSIQLKKYKMCPFNFKLNINNIYRICNISLKIMNIQYTINENKYKHSQYEYWKYYRNRSYYCINLHELPILYIYSIVKVECANMHKKNCMTLAFNKSRLSVSHNRNQKRNAQSQSKQHYQMKVMCRNSHAISYAVDWIYLYTVGRYISDI